MSRTNIDIDDDLVQIVMVRYHLKSKRDAVDYALRHLVGNPMSRKEALEMFGSLPDFTVPESRFDSDADQDTDQDEGRDAASAG